jgi:hypothetical protein
MSPQTITSTNTLQERSASYQQDQYKIWQILGIWLVAGAPMWLLGWVAYPVLSADLPPVDAGLLRIKLLTGGLIWQFVFAMVILYREEGNIRPNTIRRRFWLNHPVSAKTGETKKSLWWWIIPLFLLAAPRRYMGKDSSFLSRAKGLRSVLNVHTRTACPVGGGLGFDGIVHCLRRETLS